MVKFVKVSDEWDDFQIEALLSEMKNEGMEAIVVRDAEIEVYDGDLEQVNIENGEELEERFSGDNMVRLYNE